MGGGRAYFIASCTLCVVVMLAAFPATSQEEKVVWFVNNLSFFQLALIGLLIPAILSLNHGQKREWVWTTQTSYISIYSSWFVTIGLAIILTIVVGTMLGWLTVWLTRHVSSFQDIWRAWIETLSLLLPIIISQIFFVFGLAMLLQRPFFATAIVLMIVILVRLGIIMPVGSLLVPQNYTLLTLDSRPIVGIGLERRLVYSLLGFYFLLGAFVFLFTFGIRPYFDRKLIKIDHHAAIFSACAIVAFIGWFGLFRTYNLTAQASTVPPPPDNLRTNEWSVLRAFHDISVEQPSTNIRVASTLILNKEVADTSVNDIWFRLNPGMKLDLVLVNEREIDFEREGDAIRFDLPSRLNKLEIKLTYQGTPTVFREDYAAPGVIGTGSPMRFPVEIGAYSVDEVLYLHRDGDWLAWPYNATKQLAQNKTQINLSSQLPNLLLTNAHESEQDGTYHYIWKDSPSVLFVTGPYKVYSEAENELLITLNNGTQSDNDLVRSFIHFRQTLAEWLEEEMLVFRGVTLPYQDSVVISEQNLIVPILRSRWLTDNGIYFESSLPDRVIATLITRAWLLEKVSWPYDFTSEGYSADRMTTCSAIGSDEEVTCQTIYTGKKNPQVPYGRIRKENQEVLLLDALSISIGAHLYAISIDNPTEANNEHDYWLAEADRSGERHVHDHGHELNSGNEEGFAYNDLIPRQYTVEERHDLIHAVSSINCVINEIGQGQFNQLVKNLVIDFSGKPITSKEFALTANHYMTVSSVKTCHLDEIIHGH